MNIHEKPESLSLLSVPAAVWLAAVIALGIHFAPFVIAAHNTPPGWTFTWNLSGSVDIMQYRSWFLNTREEGWIAENHFTSEPNRPNLPLLLYWLSSRIAGRTMLPEQAFLLLGGIALFLIVILTGWTVQRFLKPAGRAWAFVWILAAGGLGAHQKLIGRFAFIKENSLLRRIFYEPFLSGSGLLPDDYRGSYVFTSISDSHFLVIWAVLFATLLSFYLTLRNFSRRRLVVAAVLSGLTTLLHFYTGITLLACIAMIYLLCRRKRLPVRALSIVSATCASIVLAVAGWQAHLQLSSGIPFSPWREYVLPLAIVLVAYPLAWLVVLPGLAQCWRNADLDTCFLLGWAGGCTAVTLSGPLYPFPVRGLVTMSIPIAILAGRIYFSRRERISPVAAAMVVLLLIPTPVRRLAMVLRSAGFSESAPYEFLSAGHREVLDYLLGNAKPEDIMVAARDDLLWLAPGFRGRLYAGHFFLTVDYQRKQAELDRFWTAGPQEKAEFLRSHRIRYLFARDGSAFAAVPGLVARKATHYGTLFESKLLPD